MIARFLNPAKVQQALLAQLENWKRDSGDDRLDGLYATLGPVSIPKGDKIVVAEGMWRNPNHFFRLRLVIEALARGSNTPPSHPSSQGGRESLERGFRLLGVLRKKSDMRERRALERIGFSDFLYLEEHPDFRPDQFRPQAQKVLARCKSHNDLLCLTLPELIPAYIWFDTALKYVRHPQPALDDPIWEKTLSDMLCYHAIYDQAFAGLSLKAVISSHPWKSEWGALCWMGLKRGAEVSHLTAFCEGIRIHRMRQPFDYAKPIEHLSFTAFSHLTQDVQNAVAESGREALAKRASGQSSDLNARYAFNPSARIEGREAARVALSGQSEKPVAVIFSHVWYDFPHHQTMTHFTDFKDWMEFTLSVIRDCPEVIWLLKPHPTENWYGGFTLADLLTCLPDHIRLLPIATDAKTALTAADAVVTVHGTGALEAAAAGVPVIAADKSYFSDWGFTHLAASREDYARLLRSVTAFPSVLETQSANAAACFACAVSEAPDIVSALRISCDSSGSKLYAEILERYQTKPDVIEQEIQAITAFYAQSDIDSFAAWRLVKTLSDKKPLSVIEV